MTSRGQRVKWPKEQNLVMAPASRAEADSKRPRTHATLVFVLTTMSITAEVGW